MGADELLRYLVTALEEVGVPYALGGSIASIAYGEPRATLDIDVVVSLDSENLVGSPGARSSAVVASPLCRA